ncbi:MAG: T9SS type A sorting domain-containing protein, partial [Bacteroidota bacterium]
QYSVTCNILDGYRAKSKVFTIRNNADELSPEVIPFPNHNLVPQSEDGFMIMPNPATNSFSWNNSNIYNVSIFDMSGRLIQQIDLAQRVNISSLVPGIYQVYLSPLDGGTPYIERLIVR